MTIPLLCLISSGIWEKTAMNPRPARGRERNSSGRGRASIQEKGSTGSTLIFFSQWGHYFCQGCIGHFGQQEETEWMESCLPTPSNQSSSTPPSLEGKGQARVGLFSRAVFLPPVFRCYLCWTAEACHFVYSWGGIDWDFDTVSSV